MPSRRLPSLAPGFLVPTCALASTCAALAFGGCGSSFSSSSGDDGGGVDAPGADATSGDGGGGDGTSGPNDAVTEPRVGWCATSNALFCEDFDQATDVNQFLASSTWSTYSEVAGQFTLQSTTDPPSPPNSFQVLAQSNATALAIRTFGSLPPNPTKLRLEFDLRVDQANQIALSAGAFGIIAFGTDTASPAVAISFVDGPRLALVWQSGLDAGATDGAAANGSQSASTVFTSTKQWAGRHAVQITYPQGAPCAQVFEGASGVPNTCVPLPPAFSSAKVVSIALGVYSVGILGGNTGAMQLEFDDVTFDVQ